MDFAAELLNFSEVRGEAFTMVLTEIKKFAKETRKLGRGEGVKLLSEPCPKGGGCCELGGDRTIAKREGEGLHEVDVSETREREVQSASLSRLAIVVEEATRRCSASVAAASAAARAWS